MSPTQGKANNKTSASGGLGPNVAAVVEDSVAREGQSKPEAVRLACCNKRFEQPVANPARNSRPRVFKFNLYITSGSPAYNVKLPPGRHCFQGVGDQVKEHALHTGAYQRQLYPLRHFDQDLDVMVVRVCRGCVGCRGDDLADVTDLGRRSVATSDTAKIC